jgi:hypothetical protein
MALRISAAVLAGCLITCGCRSQREAYLVDVFSAETRILEDKFYELNDRIEKLEERLEAQPPRASSRRDRGPEELPGQSPDGEPDIPNLTPPRIDPGSPAMPESASSTGAQPEGSDDPGTSVVLIDRAIDHIALGAETGTVDLDNRPGDDGVRISLQPRNRQGQLVTEAADVSVSLVDPVANQLVGRWHFDTRATRLALTKAAGTRGILLEVRWEEPPQNSELMLFVRYETADGRKLETNKPLEARLSNNVAERWTPRPADTPSASVARPVPTTPPPAASTRDQGPPASIYR